RFALGAVIVAATVISACSSARPAPEGGTAGAGGAQASPVTGTVTVLAAASLTEAFTTLIGQFERAHPGVTVRISYGASSALAQQIINGAPVDVFASASTKNLQQVIDQHLASGGSDFVKNVMEIAVPPGNPGKVHGLTDLARPGVSVALCQPQVPCGATAAQVFGNAGLSVTPVTQEADVKSTLLKVESNAVDAGLVYVTDVRSAGSKVLGVPIPDAVNASTEYPIATLTHAPNPAAAQAFVRFILSADGQAVLTAAGFARP
ncbi:MAG TPA: molybdate ABC transporter substrate-binding protein, partial [Jatrophihabitans sp.]|nr:molybdate ABC transporter substrate-binding protein [Jatrophihabitans sp.]